MLEPGREAGTPARDTSQEALQPAGERAGTVLGRAGPPGDESPGSCAGGRLGGPLSTRRDERTRLKTNF